METVSSFSKSSEPCRARHQGDGGLNPIFCLSLSYYTFSNSLDYRVLEWVFSLPPIRVLGSGDVLISLGAGGGAAVRDCEDIAHSVSTRLILRWGKKR